MNLHQGQHKVCLFKQVGANVALKHQLPISVLGLPLGDPSGRGAKFQAAMVAKLAAAPAVAWFLVPSCSPSGSLVVCLFVCLFVCLLFFGGGGLVFPIRLRFLF